MIRRQLRGKLVEVLGENATITTPVAKGDIRLVGFDESVEVDDITRVVAEVGECEESALKVRPMRNGLFIAWSSVHLRLRLVLPNVRKLE